MPPTASSPGRGTPRCTSTACAMPAEAVLPATAMRACVKPFARSRHACRRPCSPICAAERAPRWPAPCCVSTWQRRLTALAALARRHAARPETHAALEGALQSTQQIYAEAGTLCGRPPRDDAAGALADATAPLFGVTGERAMRSARCEPRNNSRGEGIRMMTEKGRARHRRGRRHPAAPSRARFAREGFIALRHPAARRPAATARRGTIRAPTAGERNFGSGCARGGRGRRAGRGDRTRHRAHRGGRLQHRRQRALRHHRRPPSASTARSGRWRRWPAFWWVRGRQSDAAAAARRDHLHRRDGRACSGGVGLLRLR